MHFHHKLIDLQIVIALPLSRTDDTANRYRHNYIIITFLCFGYINFIIFGIILQLTNLLYLSIS